MLYIYNQSVVSHDLVSLAFSHKYSHCSFWIFLGQYSSLLGGSAGRIPEKYAVNQITIPSKAVWHLCNFQKVLCSITLEQLHHHERDLFWLCIWDAGCCLYLGIHSFPKWGTFLAITSFSKFPKSLISLKPSGMPMTDILLDVSHWCSILFSVFLILPFTFLLPLSFFFFWLKHFKRSAF